MRAPTLSCVQIPDFENPISNSALVSIKDATALFGAGAEVALYAWVACNVYKVAIGQLPIKPPKHTDSWEAGFIGLDEVQMAGCRPAIMRMSANPSI